MAHINPIGGLVEISELNTDTSSIFYEDFSDPEDSIPSGPSAELSTNSPLVPKSHRRRRIKASRVNKKQLNYRTRLVFRVVSLIASGTTFGSLASLLYSYNGTKAATHGGGKVWPDDIQLNSTMVMLAAAVVTFVSDLALFIASAKQSVRRLEGAAMKALALATALVCASLCVAGVTIGEVWEMDPGTKTLMWTCFAKTQVWDESVTVDFPYLCGEMVSFMSSNIPSDEC